MTLELMPCCVYFIRPTGVAKGFRHRTPITRTIDPPLFALAYGNIYTHRSGEILT